MAEALGIVVVMAVVAINAIIIGGRNRQEVDSSFATLTFHGTEEGTVLKSSLNAVDDGHAGHQYHDDMDVPSGVLQLQPKGGHGSHKEPKPGLLGYQHKNYMPLTGEQGHYPGRGHLGRPIFCSGVQGFNTNFGMMAKAVAHSMTDDNMRKKAKSEKLKDVLDALDKLDIPSGDVLRAGEIFAANKDKMDLFMNLSQKLRASYVNKLIGLSSGN
ncbi:myb/SANT-like domain-containing protein [Artemisia annua]|uniref:Myb/SANT-like domain-containing protein n=1 Tax=Artemisia annua TaxID=35608 RepID=A0A2U1L2J8_ARTAN|nr:myb/SANT-like domain-containing protein [Artemisia annua]